MSEHASQPFIRHQDLPSDVVPVLIDVLTAVEWARFSKNLTLSRQSIIIHTFSNII